MSQELDDIVDVSVSANTTTPTRPGFGTPMFVGYHTVFPETSRTYTKADDMISDGFTVNDPLYRMAAAAFKQNPRVKKIKIGRLSSAVADTKKLTVLTSTQGAVISCDIVGPDGVTHSISRTVPGASSTTAEATAFAALIDALVDLTATSALAVVTSVGAVAGKTIYYKNLKNLTIEDTTADASIATDLAAIQVADSDWYGLASAIESKVNGEAIAAWAETNRKLFVAHSADDVEANGTGNYGSALKASAYDYTVPLWSRDTIDYPAAAWLGRMLATSPGAADWIYKTLKGVAVDTLSATQKTNLEAQNWSWYEVTGSRNVTKTALIASGEKIDIIVGTDWLRSEIKLSVWDTISKADKIPYTDNGVSLIKGVIQGVLDLAVTRGFLDGGNGLDPNDDGFVAPPQVTAPLVADIAPADRANRLLPDVNFSGRLAGAIRKVGVAGVLTV
jgi:hypothetical protein